MFYTIKIVIQEAQFFIAGEFDMRVKSCEASDNQNRPIQLSDGDGCVLRPKMVSKFMKMRSTDPRATVVTYAFFHAFKFPDSMAVHIKCKVEICRYIPIFFLQFTKFHSALKLEKGAISKVQKNIFCNFKNGKKLIFAPEKSLKPTKMQFSDWKNQDFWYF